jgi:hypothetical protein
MLPESRSSTAASPGSESVCSSRPYRRDLRVGGSLLMVALLLLAWLTRPYVIRSHRNFEQASAVSNARAIGLALFEFDAEYGKFPDESTVSAVKAKTATDLSLGTRTSNDFFRQLIAAEICQSETMFYAKHDGAKKPDNDFFGRQALQKGEVGFAYLVGLSSKGNPSRPIAMAPMIPGTDRFDPNIFDGRAVILKMDSSVTSIQIDKNGHALMNGMNVLDPKNPIWGSQKWRLVWPE